MGDGCLVVKFDDIRGRDKAAEVAQGGFAQRLRLPCLRRSRIRTNKGSASRCDRTCTVADFCSQQTEDSDRIFDDEPFAGGCNANTLRGDALRCEEREKRLWRMDPGDRLARCGIEGGRQEAGRALALALALSVRGPTEANLGFLWSRLMH